MNPGSSISNRTGVNIFSYRNTTALRSLPRVRCTPEWPAWVSFHRRLRAIKMVAIGEFHPFDERVDGTNAMTDCRRFVALFGEGES